MLFTSKEKLREHLIQILAFYPGSRATELQDRLCKQGRQVTDQALFKELRFLYEESVVVRAQQRYYLSIEWTLKMMEFVEQIETYSSQDPVVLQLLPAERRKRTWHFSQLRPAKRFWSQLVSFLAADCQSSTLLSWNPCPWFYYTQMEHESALMSTLQRRKIHMYKILGTKGFFHSQISKLWQPSFVSWSANESKYHAHYSWYFSVLDDYLIELHLPEKTGRDIVASCRANGRDELRKLAALHHLEHEPVKCSLTLSRSSPKAASHRKYFREYFGEG